MNPNLTRNAAVAAVGISAAISFTGVAQAITDTVFRYETPKTGYYGIGFHEMIPTRSSFTYSREMFGGLKPLGGRSCFAKVLHLPHSRQ